MTDAAHTPTGEMFLNPSKGHESGHTRLVPDASLIAIN